MSGLEGEEMFDADCLGSDAQVTEKRVGDNDFVFVKGCTASKACTILLRGANEFMLEEAERSVHDALCAVGRTLESNSVVPGGGAVETALSLHLEDYARTFESYEQWAIAEFAEALLTIGAVRNSVTAGVLEPMVSKLKSLKFATEA